MTAPPRPLPPVVLFHDAALGDFVLVWPRLRMLGSAAAVVTRGSFARLARRGLPEVRALDIEAPTWTRLWHPDGPTIEPIPEVRQVICHVASAGSRWHRQARRVFPNAAIEFRANRPPEPAPVGSIAAIPVRGRGGVALLHAGAGSPSKRWPLERTLDLAKRLEPDVALLAGEVEAEQWAPAEREAFLHAGGRFPDDLEALADRILADDVARWIGFDTGPTHLAAALGVPVLAMFGPTDPAVWTPRGPRVSILAPPGGVAEDGLARIGPDDVIARLRGD